LRRWDKICRGNSIFKLPTPLICSCLPPKPLQFVDLYNIFSYLRTSHSHPHPFNISTFTGESGPLPITDGLSSAAALAYLGYSNLDLTAGCEDLE